MTSEELSKQFRALMEGVKELFRVVVIAIIPFLLMGINTSTGEFTIDWHLVFAVAVVAALKAIDKFVHENPEINAKGVLPF